MSPTRLLEGMERIGPVFSQLYGQTECYPISLLRKADHDFDLLLLDIQMPELNGYEPERTRNLFQRVEEELATTGG